MYNVKDYFAVGNGTTDDTIAIQRAIADAHADGSGIVYFPEGLYSVRVPYGGGNILNTFGDVSLLGADENHSIIKVADGQPNYNTIIGHSPMWKEPLENITVRHLGFDGNGSGNPITDPSQLSGMQLRMALFFIFANNTHVEHCAFQGFDSMNVVVVRSRGKACIYVNDNMFTEIGASLCNHDHSVVVLAVENGTLTIRNNTFQSAGVGQPAAVTAIEAYGNQYIQNNIIQDFQMGMHVGSGIQDYRQPTKNVVIDNNQILNACHGVRLRNLYWQDNIDYVPNAHCQVTDNLITLELDQWVNKGMWNFLIGSSSGIHMCHGSTAPMHNLLVDGNTIIQNPATIFPGRPEDYMANGISLSLLKLYEQTRGRNFKVTNNIVDGALSAGMNIRMNIDNLDVSNNLFRNCGQFEQLDDSYKVGIRVWGELDFVKIKDNDVIDDRDPSVMQESVHISSGAEITESEISDNRLYIKEGT